MTKIFIKSGCFIVMALLILLVAGCVPKKIEIPEKIPSIPSEEIEIPSNDVPGTDLSDIPRFQPSVRYRYDRETWAGDVLTIFISYYAFANYSKVKEFYLSEMPKFGWKLYEESDFELAYSKDPSCEQYGPSCSPRAEIRIWETDKENLTNLEVVYYKG